jgi:hypothetical protein
MTRRISSVGIYHVALVARLVRSMGIPIEPASVLATRLLSAEGDDSVELLGELELRFDRAAFVASIDRLIADAVELTVPPRRGRPRAER